MPPPAPEVIRTDDRVHVTMTAARLDAYLSDLPALLASGDAVPHERGSDAGSRAIDGFEMTAVTAGSLLDSVGIRPGDIVADVNGAPLREVASLSLLLTDLRWLNIATLGLRRGNDRVLVVVDIHEPGIASDSAPRLVGARVHSRCEPRCDIRLLRQHIAYNDTHIAVAASAIPDGARR